MTIEEQAAECMAKQGFEYTFSHQTPEEAAASSPDSEESPKWGSVKYAETYGYATVVSPGSDSEQGSESSAEAFGDPNQEYIDSLSDPEKRAYQEALYGPALTENEMSEQNADGTGGSASADAGCYGAAATAAAPKMGDPYADPEFSDLIAKVDELDMGVDAEESPFANDKNLLKLDQKWSACMANAGYDYANSNEAQADLASEWDKAQKVEATGDQKASKIPEETQEKFLDKEFKTAVADAKCQEKLNYAGEQQQIVNGLEQKFIDENKAELDAMVVKYGSKPQAK